jgi:hypothetical protein
LARPTANEQTSTAASWSLALFPAASRWSPSVVDGSDHGSRAGLDVLPAGLPAYDLSTLTGYEEDRTGRVNWQHATYESHRGAQIVRRHYRDLLLERGWRITSNDPIRDGAALITAAHGTKEVTIRIIPKDEGVEISVAVTEVQTASQTSESDTPADASEEDAS